MINCRNTDSLVMYIVSKGTHTYIIYTYIIYTYIIYTYIIYTYIIYTYIIYTYIIYTYIIYTYIIYTYIIYTYIIFIVYDCFACKWRTLFVCVFFKSNFSIVHITLVITYVLLCKSGFVYISFMTFHLLEFLL